ncbi:MAG: hypothetical protein IJY61_04370 [Candidatus Gastranaerophilales bacterium]|nr:hypothetical protein [Candidatus Gastranaerophilales bacterium]
MNVENKFHVINDKNNENILAIGQDISNIKTEIDKNNNYTEYLVEISEGKQAEKLQNEIVAIKNELSNRDEKITSSIDEKIKILEEVFSENTINLKADITKDLTHQFREIYSYSNEHFSRLYKGLKDTTLSLEVIMNDKVEKLYKNDNDFRWEIDNIKANLNPCFEVVKEVETLKQELIKQDNANNIKLNELKKEYENQLNQQRIKYEKKLMKLEETIKEERKNPFVKFIEKIKKR